MLLTVGKMALHKKMLVVAHPATVAHLVKHSAREMKRSIIGPANGSAVAGGVGIPGKGHFCGQGDKIAAFGRLFGIDCQPEGSQAGHNVRHALNPLALALKNLVDAAGRLDR
jgi:hypothetical protein